MSETEKLVADVDAALFALKRRAEFLEYSARGHYQSAKTWKERAEKAEASLAAWEEQVAAHG